MKKLPLLLCILLMMTGCVSIDKQSRMNAFFASLILEQQQGGGATELIQFKTEDGELTSSVPSFSLSSEASEVTMTFETPYRWSVDQKNLADWISLSKTSGREGKGEFTITVDKNTSREPREAVIDIKSGDFTYHIKLKQAGAEASVEVSDEGNNKVVAITPADPESKSAEALIPVEEGFSESKPTVIEVSGVGKITFDADATAQILANAEAEGATRVFFKVEDVTGLANVPENIDIVYEVTMKTLDENGAEVYNENNAAGEVSIEIPLESDVVYVNSVALVDDEGNPLTGGVVDGSVLFDELNHTLTFKVNHFSKYAVDYVKNNEFISATGVTLDNSNLILTVGETAKISATIAPAKATDRHVSWTIDNEKIATVNENGIVEGLVVGTATITATTKNGKFTASCTVTVIPAGAVKGAFSVSPTKKVYFSQGNLQATWNGSEYTWGFAENQYDVIGNASGNISVGNPKTGDVVDLFCWSTNVTNYGICTMTETQQYEFIGDGNFRDWGVPYCNSNNVDQGTWYTPSYEEWLYLFSYDDTYWHDNDGRNATREGLYAVEVTVAGIENCLVIYPDGYDRDKVVENGDKTSYDTAQEWIVAQNEGVVCLPLGGCRYGNLNEVDDVAEDGYYNSSTISATAPRNCDRGLFIGYGYVDPGNDYHFYQSKSVRLVTEGKPINTTGVGFDEYGKGGILK